MNNSDNVTDFILKTSNSLPQNETSWFKNISITNLIIIILILSFFGINIFLYLAKGTQNISNIIDPLFKKLFGSTIATTKQVVNVDAEGAKAIVSKTSTAINNSLTNIQDLTHLQPQSQIFDTINTNKNSHDQDYNATEATSSLYSEGKSGWCYIGQEKGFRSCAKVETNDKCMSGDIFPTQEICINPNLRI